MRVSTGVIAGRSMAAVRRAVRRASTSTKSGRQPNVNCTSQARSSCVQCECNLQGNGSGADSHNPYEARLAARRELHQPGSERSCLHAELDLGSSQVSCLSLHIQ